MKIRYSILLLIIFMAGFIVLTSCTSTPGVTTTTHKVTHATIPPIRMHVAGSKLIPDEGGSPRCNTNINAKGCIAVAKGNTADVTFELQSPPSYHFTKFKICIGTKADKVATTLVCNLGVLEQADFEFTDGSGTKKYPDKFGVVILNDFSDSLRVFHLHDENRVANEYFYQVQACRPFGGVTDCVWSDPPIRNIGR